MSKELLPFTVIAEYSGFSPIPMYIIDVNEYEEFVTFVIWNELHRCKLRLNKKGTHFIYQNHRVYLSECMRAGMGGVKIKQRVFARVGR